MVGGGTGKRLSASIHGHAAFSIYSNKRGFAIVLSGNKGIQYIGPNGYTSGEKLDVNVLQGTSIWVPLCQITSKLSSV